MTNVGLARPGGPLPICNEDGDYSSTQCPNRGSVCHCVDTKTGVKADGSEHNVGEDGGCDEAVMAPTCLGGMEFNTCGTACPLSCDDLFSMRACTKQCVIGCQCPHGTVNLDGTCVDPTECPDFEANLPENCDERVKAMTNVGLARPGGPLPICNEDGDYASTQCTGSVCYCVNPNTGVELMSTTHAIGSDLDCGQVFKDSECESNKVFNQCGSPCDVNCRGPNPMCTKQCLPICQCPTDSPVWDEDGLRCITADMCPMVYTPKCEGGMEFNECGSDCDRTCDDIYPICNRMCVQRCECPAGLLLDNGICIKAENCESLNIDSLPEKCSVRNEILVSLELPPGYPINVCDESGDYASKQCIGSLGACVCVNKDTGVMVEGSKHGADVDVDCDKVLDTTCLGGMEFMSCGTACPLSCDDMFILKACTRQCVIGCQCPHGTVNLDGTCVDPTECPDFEANLPAKCEDRKDALKRVGLDRPGAPLPVCSNGDYAFTQCTGTDCYCVNPDTGVELEGSRHERETELDCAKVFMDNKCGSNKEFSRCGAGCEVTCTDLNPDCPSVCIPGCQCPPDTPIWDEELGLCVPTEECPMIETPDCEGGMVFKECGSACNKTCHDIVPICNYMCVQRCECPTGLLLDNGICIKAENCESLNTDSLPMKCSIRQDILAPLNLPPGYPVYVCDDEGNYAITQCITSMGACVCVDRISGKLAEGSEHEAGSDMCNSRGGPSKCEMEQVMVSTEFSVTCEDDGSYSPVHCVSEMECNCLTADGEVMVTKQIDHLSRDEFVEHCEYRRTKAMESKCSVERKLVLDSLTVDGPGGFIPQCNIDGRYALVQCRGAVCSCVDDHTGDDIGDATFDRGADGDCDVVKSTRLQKYPCLEQRELVFLVEMDNTIFGYFYPICEDDGNYSPTQCSGSECYCVGVTGQEMAESRFAIGMEGDCEQKRINAMSQRCAVAVEEYRSSEHLIGAFVPSCTPDGYYELVQCSGAVCFCVDEIGREVPGTEHGQGEEYGCEEKLAVVTSSECNKEREAAHSLVMLGQFVPNCKVDGSYEAVQCKGSICYCVDGSGRRLSDSEHPIHEIVEGKCEMVRETMLEPIFHVRIPKQIEVGEGSSVTCAITATEADDTFMIRINGVQYDAIPADSPWNDAEFEKSVEDNKNGTFTTAIEGFVDTFWIEVNETEIECFSERYGISVTTTILLNETESEIDTPKSSFVRLYNAKRGYMTVQDPSNVGVSSEKLLGDSQLFVVEDSVYIRSAAYPDLYLTQNVQSGKITIILKEMKGNRMQTWYNDVDPSGAARLFVLRNTKSGDKPSFLDYYKLQLTGYTATEKANQRWSFVEE